MTKVFTAAVALQLASEGRLDLDRTARSYLPDLVPSAYAGVTVRQLLDHTHGIPAPDLPGTTVEEAYAHRFLPHTPEELVRSATSKDPEFPPGTEQHYLNIGYTITGLLVERVTGHSYEDQVARRILRPLRLDDTYAPGTDPRIRGPHNHGYQVMTLDDGTTGPRDVSVWGAAARRGERAAAVAREERPPAGPGDGPGRRCGRPGLVADDRHPDRGRAGGGAFSGGRHTGRPVPRRREHPVEQPWCRLWDTSLRAVRVISPRPCADHPPCGHRRRSRPCGRDAVPRPCAGGGPISVPAT